MPRIHSRQGDRPIRSGPFPLDDVPPGTRIPCGRQGNWHKLLSIIVQVNLVVPRVVPVLAPVLSLGVFFFRPEDLFSFGKDVSP